MGEEILIKLGVDASAVSTGMRSVVSSMGSYGQAIQSALTNPIGAAQSALSSFASKVISVFDDMKNQATEVKKFASLANLSQEAAQPLMLAAQGAGVDPDAIAKSMLKVAEALEKVKKGKEGGAEALKDFANLGVSLEDIKAGNYQDIWFKISKAMNEATISQEQLVAGFSIMGKGFETLVPLFKRGTSNPVDMLKEMNEGELHFFQEFSKSASRTAAASGGFFKNVVSRGVDIVNGSDGKSGMLGRAGRWVGSFAGLDNLQDADNAQPRIKAMQEKASAQQAEKTKAAAAAEIARLAVEEKKKKEAPEALRVNQEAASIEEKHAEKILPLNLELARLGLIRKHLLDQVNDSNKSDLENAKTRKELAENDLQIAEKKKTLAEKTRDINKEVKDKRRELDDSQEKMKLHGNVNPTISDIAGPTTDFMAIAKNALLHSPFRHMAQRAEMLRADEFAARGLGNMGRAEADKKERMGIEKRLGDLGVISPDQELKSIREAVEKSQDSLTALLKKATDDGIVVIPKNSK